MAKTLYVCPDCDVRFYADSDADTVPCPNRRCGGEIDVNESRRRRRNEAVQDHDGDAS